MRNKFTTKMSICQAGNRFSLDELVKKIGRFLCKESFTQHFGNEFTTAPRGFAAPATGVIKIRQKSQE